MVATSQRSCVHQLWFCSTEQHHKLLFIFVFLQAPLRVNTSLGLIEGYNMDGTERTVFRGIPFAQPPVKTLRWRPPQKVAPWAPKVLDATKFKATCLQVNCLLLPTSSKPCLRS